MIGIVQTNRTDLEIADAIKADQAAHADTIAAFHQAFYASKQTHWMTYFEGVALLKSPMDLWVYQELIWYQKPTLIIETGTAFGGSALFFARQLDKLNAGKVISIDVEPATQLPQHPRITYVKGYSSTDLCLHEALATIVPTHPRVMVILDSDHAADHVEGELDLFAPYVTEGQSLIIEDTNLNGRPVPIDWRGGPGPGIAVDRWLPNHQEFGRNLWAERYLMTFHTWLYRRPACETV